MNYYYGAGGGPPTSPYDQKAQQYYPGQPPSPGSGYPSSLSAYAQQAQAQQAQAQAQAQAAQLQNGYAAARQMSANSRMTSPGAAAGYPPCTAYAAQSMYAPSTIYAPAGMSPYATVQSMGAPGLYQSVPQGNGPTYSTLQGSPLSAASPFLTTDPRQPASTTSNLALAGMRPEYCYPASMGTYPTASTVGRHPYAGAVPGYPSSGPMPPSMGGMGRGQQVPSGYTLVPGAGAAGSAGPQPGAGYSLSTSPYTRPVL